jgi:hypothetical protein
MKRTLSDLFENMTISRKKPKTSLQVLQTHEDIFRIGKVVLTKEYYTKNEVIEIINRHELSLMAKFKVFLTSFIPKSNNAIIPFWVK